MSWSETMLRRVSFPASHTHEKEIAPLQRRPTYLYSLLRKAGTLTTSPFSPTLRPGLETPPAGTGGAGPSTSGLEGVLLMELRGETGSIFGTGLYLLGPAMAARFVVMAGWMDVVLEVVSRGYRGGARGGGGAESVCGSEGVYVVVVVVVEVVIGGVDDVDVVFGLVVDDIGIGTEAEATVRLRLCGLVLQYRTPDNNGWPGLAWLSSLTLAEALTAGPGHPRIQCKTYIHQAGLNRFGA